MESIQDGQSLEPDSVPILPDPLLGLVRKCWNAFPDERPSASDCLEVLDFAIQEDAELAAVRSFFNTGIVKDRKLT